MTEETTSLREAKRRATKAAIEDHATRLVLERGLDEVTVDDICQAAGISKRTFFNYMDSKDCAVIGPPPRRLSEEDVAAFATATHEDLLDALIGLALQAMGDPSGSSDRTIISRRKRIRSTYPHLAYERMATFHTTTVSCTHAVATYLTRNPEQRLLPHLPVEDEAAAWVIHATSCIQLGIRRFMAAETDSVSLAETCHAACADLASLAHLSVKDPA